MNRRVIVADATGRLGMAVVDRLCSAKSDEFDVSVFGGLLDDDATDLRRNGATLLKTTLSDADAVSDAVSDADAIVFAVETADPDDETTKELAETLLQAAEENDCSQFVLVSAAGVDAGAGDEVPEFAAVRAIEEAVREASLPWTVVHPAYTVQRFEAFREGIESGMLTLPLEEDGSLHVVDGNDVARVVAAVLADPESFERETVEFAAGVYTLDELADAFADVLGHDITGVHAPMDVARDELPEREVARVEFANAGGYAVQADLDDLETRFGFEFTTLESYLRAEWATETAQSSQSMAD
ncbi:hypothetical protein AUR64_08360 [Haloprofundus marisrubri]|uniref:NmrA-like domain-containing protein n=1 Tax=Haloprofundus marisrubri TaxID=1514971 RepID=A0A0W1R8L5_9EURY|nr:NmrA family NAD(P)-binding protein [Haloprofundus marisrubri]KTG09647.1 hypothetical protein AUR64_08360 [Haloprofundus marisrubri]